MAALDQLTGLIEVIQGVQGSKTKSKSTTQANVSDQGVQQLISQILSGAGGVADIGSAARHSGLYNSTTEDMLLGDLYARAANQAELARTPTTTTETATVGGVGLDSLGTVLAAAQLGSKLIGSGSSAGNVGASIASRLNPFASTTKAAPIVSSAGQAGIASGAQAFAAPGASSTGITVGTNLASEGANVAGGALSKAGNFVGTNAIPLGGSLLSGLIGGKDAAKDPKNLAITAGLGAMSMGPIGVVAAPIASLLGGLLKDGGLGIGSELKRTGRKVEKEIKRVGRKIGKIFGW